MILLLLSFSESLQTFMLEAALCMLFVLLYLTGIAHFIDLKERALKQTCRHIPIINFNTVET